jgi:hypothetical protein
MEKEEKRRCRLREKVSKNDVVFPSRDVYVKKKKDEDVHFPSVPIRPTSSLPFLVLFEFR